MIGPEVIVARTVYRSVTRTMLVVTRAIPIIVVLVIAGTMLVVIGTIAPIIVVLAIAGTVFVVTGAIAIVECVCSRTVYFI